MTLPHNTLYWHCHHDVLCEFVDNPQERIDYIIWAKPNAEIDIRLRLFQPVKGKLPPDVVEAWAAYDKARAAYDKARENHREELEALHAKECPNCPWDGKTIFPEENEK